MARALAKKNAVYYRKLTACNQFSAWGHNSAALLVLRMCVHPISDYLLPARANRTGQFIVGMRAPRVRRAHTRPPNSSLSHTNLVLKHARYATLRLRLPALQSHP